VSTLLRAEGIWKSFADKPVLRGVDLSLETHEVVALIGSSGSGKSTLLRCLNLLEPIDDGRILLGDDDISDPRVNADRIRSRFGIVFQSYNLFPHMTVMENVMLAPTRVGGISKTEARTRGEALLESVGMSDKAASYPDMLSGGQQQRVAIVRALAMQPRVMLLDEITAALDPELVGDVLEIVRELAHGGLTMLLATHEMGFAKEVASQVCFLDAGQILERGSAQQIFEDPQEERTQQFLSRVVKSGRL
jgi:polar amino acid transport system ATP-binding protein